MGLEPIKMLGAWPKGEECNDHKYWVLKVQVCLSLTSAEPFRLLYESPTKDGASLPPARHVLDLIDGSMPTHRKNYRFSPLEVKELKESVLIDEETYKKLLPYVSL
jgi:hypothetical protein